MKTIKKKTADVIDHDTGEIRTSIETITVYKDKGDKGFIKIFRACTDAVLKDLEVDDGRLRLLFWFIKQVQDKIETNSEHIIIAHVNSIAKELNTSDMSVRRWLQILIERGYIKRHRQDKKVIYNTYEINKNYIYKGVLSKMS